MAKTTNASDKVIIRLPDGMRDRIKTVAEKNGRTMNAEIVAVLEEKFPPPSIDLNLLAQFLDTLMAPFSDDPTRPDYDNYIKYINNTLADAGANWTVKSDGFGVLSFYPYSSSTDDHLTQDKENE